MNYGRKGTSRKEKKLTSKSTMVRKKFGVIFCKTLLVCFLLLLVVGICAGIGVVKGIIDQAPDIDEIDASPTGQLSTVLDDEGNEIATLVASGSNREPVTLDQIPIDLQHAFVAIEDARFYEHNGIDIKGIIRAGFSGIANGFHFDQGASTITQQLLKNNVFTDWVNEEGTADKIERKLQEQYLAIQLEKRESKDWILENYLNTINLGQNTLGVQAASKRYFNKDVSELNLSECAVIAAITKSPYGYNPITHPDKNASRRKSVLDAMLEQGYITQSEYDEAMADDVYERIQLVDASADNSNAINSYFVDALSDQVMDDLMEKLNYTETQAYNAVYSGGLTIYSTQNPDIQAICDEEINNPDNYGDKLKYSFSYRLTIDKADGSRENYSEQTMLSYYRDSSRKGSKYNINFDSIEEAQAAIDQYKEDIMEEGDTISETGESVTFTLQPQASMTVIDQYTGEVKALVGGRGEKVANKTLNRATDTTRQAGSTFKILGAYAPALDSGGFTLASVQDNAPLTYPDGTVIHNYDNKYTGFTTLREAITNSINIVTVKTMTEAGIDLCYGYVEDFGFTTVDYEHDANPSLCLGGLYTGVTNLELTAAYATIANSGTYTKPRMYTKILDYNGNVLIDNTPETHTVLKETTAWLLTDAMQDVVTHGSGTKANFGTMPIAGKTGTTTSNRDALFAGYTPYYTCAVWTGYDDNAPLSSTTAPKVLWRNAMSRIHEGLEAQSFTMPSGITSATVCKKSGKLAVEGLCDSDPRGSMVESEYFASGTVPTEVCDHHVSATICADSGLPAGPFCPETSKVTSVFIIGGSEDTGDGPYLLTEEVVNSVCDVHTSANSDIQQITDPGTGTTDPQQPSGELNHPSGSLEGGSTTEGQNNNNNTNGSSNGTNGSGTGNTGTGTGSETNSGGNGTGSDANSGSTGTGGAFGGTTTGSQTGN
ncbi:MAG: penicillin-binding protein [Lachnospiraceae bacterium]|nr:penicillin-binding protein [Lachnospiraceae bacterium]